MARRHTGARRHADRMAAGIKLLGLLAQRGAYVPAPVSGGTDVAVVIEAPQGTIRETGRFAITVLAEAEAQGWVDAADESGRLGLTVAGRRALKEVRSRLVQIKAGEAIAAATLSHGAAGPGVNHAESPLSWLRSRRDGAGRPMMGDAQFAAGERLRAELTFAQLTPRITMAWSGIAMSSGSSGAGGSAQDLADSVVAARARVTAAIRAVGPEFADILIDVCGHLKGLEVIARAEGWPSRSAKLLLQRALTALARHYGLIPEVPAERTIAERLRHWGADDYRPTLAGGSRASEE